MTNWNIQEVFKALGDGTRLQIVFDLFKHEEMTSGEIAEKFPAAWGTISRHLSILKSSGLILEQRKGRNIYYRVNEGCLSGSLLSFIRKSNLDLKEKK